MSFQDSFLNNNYLTRHNLNGIADNSLTDNQFHVPSIGKLFGNSIQQQLDTQQLIQNSIQQEAPKKPNRRNYLIDNERQQS